MKPRRLDLALAAAFLAGELLQQALDPVAGNTAVAALAAVGWSSTVLLRRRFPFVLVVAAAAMVYLRWELDLKGANGSVSLQLFTAFAVFGVARQAATTRRAGVLVALSVGLIVGNLAFLAHVAGVLSPASWTIEELLLYSLFFAASGIAGIALRDRSAALAAARRRAAAQPPPEDAAARARREERRRIALELPHVVRSSVTGVLAESATARAGLAGAAPARARAALDGAIDGCQGALGEMRRLVRLLRREPAPAPAVDHDAAGEVIPHRGPLTRFLSRQWIVLVVLTAGVVQALILDGPVEVVGDVSLVARLAGAIVTAACFLGRRRFPLLTVCAVTATVYVRGVVIDEMFPIDLPIWLAAFSAAAYVRALPASIAGGAIAGGGGCVAAAQMGELPPGPLVWFVAMTIAAWVVGRLGRDRLEDARELDQFAEAEERRRADAVARAVGEERLGVAREMHDLVGHGLTLMAVQAGAAHALAERRPDAALDALDAVEHAGAEVLDELDQLLEALDGDPARPAPGVGDIATLVAAAGPDRVHLHVEGDPDHVPAGPGTAAYRIVQEALTNARKHGGRGDVDVTVACDPDAIRLTVVNPTARRRRGDGTRLGLVGMEERAAVYGGTVDARRDGERWIVRAELPLAAVVVDDSSLAASPAH